MDQSLAQNPQSSVWKPQPGLQISELFSGPHSGTFFYAFFAVFPGNAKNNVDARNAKSGFELTYFEAFPGNAKNNVGSAGSTLFFDFLQMRQKSSKKKVPKWGPKKQNLQASLEVPGQVFAQT